MRPADRVAARVICSTSAARGSPGSRLRPSRSLKPRMAASMLLRSCAIPPASRPTASSRRLSWRCSSVRRRSVRSSTTPAESARRAIRRVGPDRPTAMIQCTLPSGQTTRYSAEYARAPRRLAPSAPARARDRRGGSPPAPGPRHRLVGRCRTAPWRARPWRSRRSRDRAPRCRARRLQRQLERVLLPAELLLDLLVLREVAHPPGEAEQAPLAIVHAGGGEGSPEAAAIVAQQPAVVVTALPGGLGQIRGRGAAFAGIVGIEVGSGDLQEFGLLVAQHPADPGIPAGRLPSGSSRMMA